MLESKNLTRVFGRKTAVDQVNLKASGGAQGIISTGQRGHWLRGGDVLPDREDHGGEAERVTLSG